ncbi:MAG: cell division protein FtsZ, partial [Dokdonella sp.]
IIAPRPPMRVVRNATTGEIDYAALPQRMTATQRAPVAEAQAVAAADTQIDYLDIPAFLRRQAD